ncbi:MAG: MBL fold metallo-hydrolase [Candidatus Euphemobacter frigidus]|nr:MBL fold metallo-hydrolase [Candidatus Euphemobacter frigidus]MDP8276543.1 MBL fold metallo-hydrolase [Candidatus Euphemobacter frigidus]
MKKLPSYFTGWITGAVLALLLISGLSPLSCKKRKEGEASCTTEFLEVNLKKFPENQYNIIPDRSDADKIIQAGEAVKLTFYGATRIVGGSCMLLEYKGKKLLIDAGIFFMPSLVPLNKRFEFDPGEIDYVILTHAHADHNARLPLLYQLGYKGSIYGTPPTKDISDVMLQLGVGLTARRYRVDFRNKTVHSRSCNKARGLRPDEFLDVRSARTWINNLGYRSCRACQEIVKRDKAVLSNKVNEWFQTVQPEKWMDLEDGIRFRLHNAGHILGSSQVELILGKGKEAITLVFGGDYGNQISPLIRPPDQVKTADYVITEATYGMVRKEFTEPYFDDFINAVVSAVRRGERVIIPAFVLSKSQKIISVLAEEAYLGRIPKNCPIIVTSPTVKKLNDIYQKYLQQAPEEYFSERTKKRQKWRNPFQNEQFFFGSINNYRKKYREIRTPAIFLVSSGMMDFASSLEMAEKYLSDPRSNFFIVGWQSPTSVGRAAMKLPEVVIKGKTIPVRAKVKKFGQFSSHGDLTMLLDNIKNYRNLKGVIVQHGEAESALNLAHLIHQDFGYPVFVPAFLNTLWLDKESFLKVDHDFSFSAQRLRQLDPVLELPQPTLEKKQQVAYNNLAQAEKAYRGDNMDLALKYARDAVRRYSALADAYYLMGKIFRKKGKTQQMRQAFQKAVEINPYNARFYLGLARSYLQEGKTNDTIRELRTCLYYQPEDIEALALLGEIYCNSNLESIGLELLKAANSIDPYDEEVSVQLEEVVREKEKRRIYYLASRNGKYFHYPWCPVAQKIYEQNRIRFKSRSDALKKGYMPCIQCNP